VVMISGLLQVARVFAPSASNGRTSVTAANGAGSTSRTIATAITKLASATMAEGVVAFPATQNGRLKFGPAGLTTATALDGIPIAANAHYMMWVHRVTSAQVSWFNASGSTGYLVYWDPEKP